MDTIKQCFEIILKGDNEQSRQAARRVGKLVYYGPSMNKGKYSEIARLVETAPKTFSSIHEDWRQENFVMAVSLMYFVGNKRDKPDFLFPWFFQLLQHPRGR